MDEIEEHTDLGPAAAQHDVGGAAGAEGAEGAKDAEGDGAGARGDGGGGGETVTRSVVVSLDEAELGEGVEKRLERLLGAVMGKLRVPAASHARRAAPRHRLL